MLNFGGCNTFNMHQILKTTFGGWGLFSARYLKRGWTIGSTKKPHSHVLQWDWNIYLHLLGGCLQRFFTFSPCKFGEDDPILTSIFFTIQLTANLGKLQVNIQYIEHLGLLVEKEWGIMRLLWRLRCGFVMDLLFVLGTEALSSCWGVFFGRSLRYSIHLGNI